MGEQQSQKRGLRSEAQKEAGARNVDAPVPSSNPVGGAFGEHKTGAPSDEDVALRLDEKSRQQRKREDQLMPQT